MVFKSENGDYLKFKENIDRFLPYTFSIFPEAEKHTKQLKEEIRIWEKEIIDYFNIELNPYSSQFIEVFGEVGAKIMEEGKAYFFDKMSFVEREYKKLQWELEEKNQVCYLSWIIF